MLSFVVVGGGPTGVEVAAELHDMVVDDLRKIYPELMPCVRIRVIELQDHVLSTYDREISKYTAQEFSRHALLTWLVLQWYTHTLDIKPWGCPVY